MTSRLEDALHTQVERHLETLRRRSAHWQPNRLENVRRQLCGEREVPLFDPRTASRFDDAMVRLLEGGTSGVAARDHVVLAYNLAEPHAQLGQQSLLNALPQLTPLIERWRALLRERSIHRQIWRGALLSLFRASSAEAGFEVTRRFLSDTLGILRTNRFQPQWLAALDEHPRLLERDAADAYALEWISGERTRTDELKELVDLPQRSWFWTSLVEAVLDACCNTSNDALYDERWPVALELMHAHPHCRDRILGRILARYASQRVPKRDERLLRWGLDVWGSPQLGADVVGRWSATSAEARAMVCGWLAEEDLEDFAAFCKGDDSVDERRLVYWLRFKKQIRFSRIVLGAAIAEASDSAGRDFVARKKGRLGYLRGTPNNNAIMLCIGDWWFVEFSEKGNACYPYREDQRPFETGEKHFDLKNDLKDAAAVDASGGKRLSHMGPWEETFDRFLAERGVWPDGVSAPVHRSLPRPSTPLRRNVPDRPAPAARLGRADLDKLGLDQVLIDQLAPLSPHIVDNRSLGGSLWIEINRLPSPELRRAMERHAYRYAKPRGFYRK